MDDKQKFSEWASKWYDKGEKCADLKFEKLDKEQQKNCINGIWRDVVKSTSLLLYGEIRDKKNRVLYIPRPKEDSTFPVSETELNDWLNECFEEEKAEKEFNEKRIQEYINVEKQLQNVQEEIASGNVMSKEKLERKEISLENKKKHLERRGLSYNDSECKLTPSKMFCTEEIQLFEILLTTVKQKPDDSIGCNKKQQTIITSLKKGKWEVIPLSKRLEILEKLLELYNLEIWEFADEKELKNIVFRVRYPIEYRIYTHIRDMWNFMDPADINTRENRKYDAKLMQADIVLEKAVKQLEHEGEECDIEKILCDMVGEREKAKA